MKRKLDLKINGETFKARPSDVKILNILMYHPEGLNQKTLRMRTKLSKGEVSKRLKRLKTSKVIIEPSPGFYTIEETQRKLIKLFLNGFEIGNKYDIFDIHAVAYEFEVLNLSKKELKILEKKERWIQFNPRHHIGMAYEFEDTQLIIRRFRDKTIMTVFLSVFSPDSRLGNLMLKQKLDFTIEMIKKRFPGIVLEKREKVFSVPYKEVAWLLHPFAQAGMLLGVKNRWKEIEASWGVPEWEEKGREALDKINEMYDFFKNVKQKRQTKHCKD